ncbi:MAG TPA: sulfite exporter TauE/SafE family protein [Acidimicrobiia bacterium]|nr:sulfite exporter TauE/SafE family protein [Acidimicrobiia bacterium]
MDWWVALAGLGVGFVMGLTGMGGGALMTPILVLGFGVPPLAAVSSDLMASLVMKPVGAGVHLRRGTVNLRLVGWLVAGSVPAAFCGVLLLRAFGDGLQNNLELILGVALVLAAGSIVARTAVQARRGLGAILDGAQHAIAVRPIPTLAIGCIGGLIVGITSVGSGSLMIVMLLVAYPTLSASQLVGTDLAQAIPLVGAAALGHLLFGDFQLALTASLLVGGIPGTYFGARLSARAPDQVIRPVLVAVLLLSGLKLIGVSDVAMLVVAGVSVVALAAVLLPALRSRPTEVPRER